MSFELDEVDQKQEMEGEVVIKDYKKTDITECVKMIEQKEVMDELR